MARPKKNQKPSKNDSEISNEEKKTLSTKTKSKGLFDHINHIREVKSDDYYTNLSDVEKKSFSKYTLLMGLSMDVGSIESMAYLSRYFESIPNEQFYKVCCDLTPSGRKFCKWIKSSATKYNEELIEILSKHFQLGSDEVKDYCKILLKNESGISYITDICKLYGKTDKEIERLFEQ